MVDRGGGENAGGVDFDDDELVWERCIAVCPGSGHVEAPGVPSGVDSAEPRSGVFGSIIGVGL